MHEDMASGNPSVETAAGAESPTALLPLNAFGGKTPEVGKVCKFRVVRVYNDQAEVEYVPHGEGEDEYAEPGEAVPQGAQEGEMTSYLE